MDGPGGFFVIGLGYREDAGGFGGPLYLEELEGEEFALPVFFGPGPSSATPKARRRFRVRDRNRG
ncbi:MAG: hypothetical protein ACJ73W_03115 [Rubrobacteraceae bacterium]